MPLKGSAVSEPAPSLQLHGTLRMEEWALCRHLLVL